MELPAPRRDTETPAIVLLHICTTLVAWKRPISFHQASQRTTVQPGRSMGPASLAHFQFESLGVVMQVPARAGIVGGKSVLVGLEEPERKLKSIMKPWVHRIQATVSPQDLWRCSDFAMGTPYQAAKPSLF